MAVTFYDKKVYQKPDHLGYMAALTKIITKHGSLEQNLSVDADDQAFIDKVEAEFGITINVGSYTALGTWTSLRVSDRKYCCYRTVVS